MKKLIIVLTLISSFITLAKSDDYLIIVNENNPISEIKRSELASIFLKKNIHWEDNSIIMPFNHLNKEPGLGWLLHEVINLKELKWERYWIEQKFRTGKVKPREISERFILKMIAETKNGISYIAKSKWTEHKGIKVIAIK